MRKFLVALLFGAALTQPVLAQVGLPWPGPGTAHSTAAGFTGIGDVQSGWAGYYGVIPYSAAYATALGNAFDFSCNSGGITGTVAYQASGALNVTPVASCSGTIAVTKVYDEAGDISCSGSVPCPLTTISAGSLSFLQSGCPATSVVTYCLSGSGLTMASGVFSNTAVPYTLTAVFDRPTSARGSFRTVFGIASGSTLQMGASTNNDKVFIYAGTAPQEDTGTDGTTHTMQGVFNGASSTTKVDAGAVNTVASTPGTSNISGGQTIGIGGGNPFTGYIYQVGIYVGGLNSTVQGNVAHNQCVNTGSAAAPTC